MIISDLEYLEVVSENRVEGGLASIATSAASTSATGTNTASGSSSVNTYTFLIQNSVSFLPQEIAGSFSQAFSTASAD